MRKVYFCVKFFTRLEFRDLLQLFNSFMRKAFADVSSLFRGVNCYILESFCFIMKMAKKKTKIRSALVKAVEEALSSSYASKVLGVTLTLK